MNPNEFVRALIDGTTRFIATYLTFVAASLKSPLRFYARQYYRSYIAADREISATSFLAVTALAIVFISPLLSGKVPHDSGFTKYAMTLSSSTDLTLSVAAAAIAITILIEMTGRSAFAHIFIHAARTQRFHRVWLLAMASSAVWAWIAYWLLFWATTIWPLAHDAFTPPRSLVSMLVITALVTARQLTPLARYMRQCRNIRRPRLQSKIARPVLLVPFSAALLCGSPFLFLAMISVLLPNKRQVSIMHVACDSPTAPHQPIRGSVMIRNETPNGASFTASFQVLVNFGDGRLTPLAAVLSPAEGTNMLYLNVDDVAIYRFSAQPPQAFRAATLTLRPGDCKGLPPDTLPRE